MKKILFIAFFTTFVHLCSLAQADQKKEALDFCIKVVTTYFQKDCHRYLEFLGDSITLLAPMKDTTISTENIKNDTASFCKRWNNKIRFANELTLDYYLKNYEVQVYEKKEYTNATIMRAHKVDPLLIEILTTNKVATTNNQYLFWGFYSKEEIAEHKKKLKNSPSNAHDYTSNHSNKLYHFRSWVFMVEKINGTWKIVKMMP